MREGRIPARVPNIGVALATLSLLLVLGQSAAPGDAAEVSAAASNGVVNGPGLAARVVVIRSLGEDVLTPDATPPDPTGAVSRRHYVQGVNGQIATFRRRGLRRVSRMDLSRFWGVFPYATGDPQVAWDQHAGRWYAASHEISRNALLFAWSKTSNPTNLRGGWCRVRIQDPRLLPDFPMLGFSRNHVLIGVNMADKLAERIVYSRIWAIAKPKGGKRGRAGCGRPPMKAFGSAKKPLRAADGNLAGVPVPASSPRPGKAGWVVAADCVEEGPPDPGQEPCAHDDPGRNQITVWRVNGPPDSPQIKRVGGINIPRTAAARLIPQPGTKGKLDPSDTRFSQAVANRDPSLGGIETIWAAHAVAGPDRRAVIRWYQIDPAVPSIARAGTIASPGNWAVYPAISPTFRGDSAAIHYVVAGANKLPRIRARFRRLGDSPGTLRGRALLGRSSAPPSSLNCDQGFCRYGDYAGATPDPLRRNAVWGTNELLGPWHRRRPAFPNWRTRIFALPSPGGTAAPRLGMMLHR